MPVADESRDIGGETPVRMLLGDRWKPFNQSRTSMSFKYQLKDAGFRSKRQFALYAGLSPTTVSRWGEKPPKLVKLHLKLLTSLRGYTERPIYKE